MPKVTMHRVSRLLTLSTLPMSQAVKTPRVCPCEPLCARLGDGVACVPAEGMFSPHRASTAAAQLQRGTSPPLRNPQLSEGTREIILERSLIMKKDIKFSTRMASADREKIRALAAKAHMSMSDYVTACCLGKRIVVIDEQKELLRQLKGIGSNINRLTVLANMGKVQVIGLDKVAQELSEVSAALRSVMEGR